MPDRDTQNSPLTEHGALLLVERQRECLPDQFCHLQFSLADDDTLCGASWVWADHPVTCQAVGVACRCGKTLCPLCEVLYKARRDV